MGKKNGGGFTAEKFAAALALSMTDGSGHAAERPKLERELIAKHRDTLQKLADFANTQAAPGVSAKDYVSDSPVQATGNVSDDATAIDRATRDAMNE